MKNNLIQQSCNMLAGSWHPEEVQVEPLTPDGSLRRFFRMIRSDGSRVVVVAPPAGDSVGLREASSAWQIGRHLFVRGIPVPELYGFDRKNGLLICEDLGDVRLHKLVVQHGTSSELVIDLYRRSVVWLARMQVRGRENFESSWCWDTQRYDRNVMLERESGYFLQALCRDMLNLVVEEQALQEEFYGLADRAEQADASFFMHRDFQSRNIMVCRGRVRFIDFQGGRLGPAPYDLASLLIDPYAALPAHLQDELLDLYLNELTALISYDRQRFKDDYLVLGLQRNLQILGAFAFLCNQRSKPFFFQYILPSLCNLQTLLAKVSPDEYSCLKSLTEQCLSKIDRE